MEADEVETILRNSECHAVGLVFIIVRIHVLDKRGVLRRVEQLAESNAQALGVTLDITLAVELQLVGLASLKGDTRSDSPVVCLVIAVDVACVTVLADLPVTLIGNHIAPRLLIALVAIEVENIELVDGIVATEVLSVRQSLGRTEVDDVCSVESRLYCTIDSLDAERVSGEVRWVNCHIE